MPMKDSFKERLFPKLSKIEQHFQTPFHIYDEIGIKQSCNNLKKAFSNFDFQEFFAVKALPNLSILKIIKNVGFGFDASSIPELILAQEAGANPEDIFFSSNNTSQEEFDFSYGTSILNLDDISFIEKIKKMPELICFRYNPGKLRTGNSIIGNPAEAKYGLTHNQIFEAYKIAKQKGAKRFGLHTMLISNELNYEYMAKTIEMLSCIATKLYEKEKIALEFINMGGGMGIPYKPEDKPFNLEKFAQSVEAAFKTFYNKNGYKPKFFMEQGRYITGPNGVLVSKVINIKDTYRKYIGLDSCMSSLMRPAIYGAYHHIDVLGKDNITETEIVDVVGSLCENNDKFAIERKLPKIKEEDLLIIHDTGAHGHAMGFNYNGRLRPKELLLREDGKIELIRRQETNEDYFATLNFQEDILD